MEIVDLHIHGIMGYDTNTEDPEDIIKISEIEKKLGISAILLTIYPGPIEKMRRNMEVVKEAMKRKEGGSEILGIHLEGPFLNPKMYGALDPTFFLEPSVETLKRLIEGFEDIVRIITLSPELEGAIELIKEIRQMGILANMGHSEATYKMAEWAFENGATGITHIFNAQRPFHHREPGIAGFGLLNPDVYIEVIGDGVHLHEKVLDMILRLKPQDRIILVSDSVRETKMETQEKEAKIKGGRCTLREVANLLLMRGYNPEMVKRWLRDNPLRYLDSKYVQK